MTEENLHQEEEVETTPPTGSESEDAGDLQSLFADEESQEDQDPQDKIKSLEEKITRIEKGVSKYFSDKGRAKSKAGKETAKSDISDVDEMFLEQKPEAELVKDTLKNVADNLYNGSLVKAWKGETWIQDKASALAKAKKEEEEAKANIDSPSGGVRKGNRDQDWASLTEAQIADLSVEDYEKYRTWRLKQ